MARKSRTKQGKGKRDVSPGERFTWPRFTRRKSTETQKSDGPLLIWIGRARTLIFQRVSRAKLAGSQDSSKAQFHTEFPAVRFLHSSPVVSLFLFGQLIRQRSAFPPGPPSPPGCFHPPRLFPAARRAKQKRASHDPERFAPIITSSWVIAADGVSLIPALLKFSFFFSFLFSQA